MTLDTTDYYGRAPIVGSTVEAFQGLLLRVEYIDPTTIVFQHNNGHIFATCLKSIELIPSDLLRAFPYQTIVTLDSQYTGFVRSRLVTHLYPHPVMGVATVFQKEISRRVERKQRRFHDWAMGELLALPYLGRDFWESKERFEQMISQEKLC
jgi:hypothetical protein